MPADLLLRLRGDDAAVSEVVGFILMFAISAIILVLSMQAFNKAQDGSNDLLAAVELKNIANRISTRIVQAGIVSQEFPDATFEVVVRIPEEVAGYRYTIEFRDRNPSAADPYQGAFGINDPNAEPIVYLRTQGDPLGAEGGTVITGESSLFKVEDVEVRNLAVYLEPGQVWASEGAVTIRYWLETDPIGGNDDGSIEGHLEILGGVA